MKKQRIKMTISYYGNGFYGWQKQPQHPTIQGNLEKALSIVLQTPTSIIASGRTDAGAHALNQVVHFDVPDSYTNWTKLKNSLESLTSDQITIKSLALAPPEFHSLNSCIKKTYYYYIVNRPNPLPMFLSNTHWEPFPLNVTELSSLTSPLLGTHDFKSFQNTGTPVPSTTRTLYELNWEKKRSGLIRLTLTGDGFLKQMVRNIAGTTLFLYKKGEKKQRVKDILAQKNPQASPFTAPASGLYLAQAHYPQKLDKKCQKI